MKRITLFITALFCVSAFAQDLPNAAATQNPQGIEAGQGAAPTAPLPPSILMPAPISASNAPAPILPTAAPLLPDAAAAPSAAQSKAEAAAPAKHLPKIAVYVTGSVGDDEKQALGTIMLATLLNSGRYIAVERSNTFLAKIEEEQVKQRGGDIDDSQISELGKQFGVKFICIADITPAFGDYQVSARIVNVETAEVAHIGQASGQLASIADLSRISERIVESMFKKPDEVVTFEDIFFPSKKGAALTTACFDQKGKLVNYLRLTVVDVTGSADSGAIVYTMQIYNKKMRPLMREAAAGTALVKNGVVELPVDNIFGGIFGGNVEITEVARERLPYKLAFGNALPKFWYYLKCGFIYKIGVSVTDRKCTGTETVTLPAGTFESYKVEQKQTALIYSVEKVFTRKMWYVRGVGAVKTEIYDDKGVMLSSAELQEIDLSGQAREQQVKPIDVPVSPVLENRMWWGGNFLFGLGGGWDIDYSEYSESSETHTGCVVKAGYYLDLIYAEIRLFVSSLVDGSVVIVNTEVEDTHILGKYPVNVSIVKRSCHNLVDIFDRNYYI